jgi:NAD(P)-dependent dehydrogenase (short-subunit alcohol dehydrogenase family)
MEMVRRNHDLVLGDAKDGLADELTKLGAKVEVVPGTADQTRRDTIQKLVDRAKEAFGGFDSACIRTGVHGTGNLLDSTAEDCDIQYEGNFRSVFYALKALLPPLVEQKSGQVVINTSAAGARVQNWFALYGATRAGANALIKAAGLEVPMRWTTRASSTMSAPTRTRPSARRSRISCRCGSSASPRRPHILWRP